MNIRRNTLYLMYLQCTGIPWFYFVVKWFFFSFFLSLQDCFRILIAYCIAVTYILWCECKVKIASGKILFRISYKVYTMKFKRILFRNSKSASHTKKKKLYSFSYCKLLPKWWLYIMLFNSCYTQRPFLQVIGVFWILILKSQLFWFFFLCLLVWYLTRRNTV